jgi:hypothetical protein
MAALYISSWLSLAPEVEKTKRALKRWARFRVGFEKRLVASGAPLLLSAD